MLTTGRLNITPESDLVAAVCSWVGALTQDCTTVIIAFDT